MSRERDSSPPRRRNSNDERERDSSPPRRRNNNNDVRERDSSPPRRRNNNNNNNNNKNNRDSSPPQRNNNDRERDSSPPRKRNNGYRENDKIKNENMNDNRKTKTSSGLTAGLVTKEDIIEEAKEIKRKKEIEFNEIDSKLLGEGQETTYRDKRGRKLDMLNEFMRQQALREGKEIKIEKAQYEWGKGTVQKEDEKEAQKELELIADQPFARTIDDVRLDSYKKQIIHDDDPMAEYFKAKREKELDEQYKKSEKIENLKPRKPIYKGPTPPPNRFNILPGFRWDAVDRGNGFESKLFKNLSSKIGNKEDSYKFSSADM